MANNSEISLRGAKKLPPLRVDRDLLTKLKAEMKTRKHKSLAMTIRVICREALAAKVES